MRGKKRPIQDIENQPKIIQAFKKDSLYNKMKFKFRCKFLTTRSIVPEMRNKYTSNKNKDKKTIQKIRTQR